MATQTLIVIVVSTILNTVLTSIIHQGGPYTSIKRSLRSSGNLDVAMYNDFQRLKRTRLSRDVVSNLAVTQHFTERLISPGEDASLQCTANGERPPRFVWERDSVIISPNLDQRYILSQMMSPAGMGVMSQLNITHARVEDGGLYSCIAIEGDTRVRHTARLDVYGPPYIRNLPPIKVQNGDTLRLRCPYYGYPISKLEWEHKGKKIVSSIIPAHARYKRHHVRGRRKRQLFGGNDNGVLTIQRIVKEEHGASYVCIVYSPTEEMARRSFEIQVVEAPELDELRVGSGLKEGQIVQITCNIISGDQPVFFSWLKDGKKIPSNLKVTERSTELFSVLIIKRVALDHCGAYTCIATNHVGKVNQTADLYINVAPKWIEEPSNTSVLLGQRGIVNCNANGYPTPQIHWMKKDEALGIWRPVLDLAGGGIMSFSNGTLVIEVVSLSDDGMYSCHVENGVGEALNKNVWISVNKPVHFESSFTNVTSKIGYPVQLTCQPLGDHPIRVKWSLDGRAVDFTTSRVKISEALSDHYVKNTIDISHVEGRDGGVYECKASNPYGVALHNIYLSILEPPMPPTDFQVESVSSRSVTITWRENSRTQTQYYTIQYLNNHYTTWDHAKQVNVTRQDLDLRQNYEIKDLQPSTDYKLRVSASNQADMSEFTSPAHVTTQQEAPSSSPTLIKVHQTENPGELSVTWSPPPKDSHNGPIQGYHVKAEPRVTIDSDSEDKTRLIKVISRKGQQETIVSGLLKNTRYAVSVSAFNAAGSGPFSLPVYDTTREGAPEEAPSSLECTAASSSSVRVSWLPISARGQGGSLLGYTVYYALEDEPWKNITSPQSELYLQKLMKFSNYSIKVAGYSNFGVGPSSYHIICATLQDVPGPPSVIKALVSSSTSLVVSWSKPELSNGIIIQYTVYAKPAGSTNSPKAFRVQPQESNQITRHLRFELKELTESRQYEVCVSASTIAGEGLTTQLLTRDLTNKVVAGISSIGGTVSVGVGRSVLLVCECVGSPPPRSVWYHNTNILTHHPRYTRNHDDSLLINNIDQSVSGNYTCLAKNLYGSDSVSYTVTVVNSPDPPVLRAVPHKDTIQVEWDQPLGGQRNRSKQRINYHLSWKEGNGSWKDSWSTKANSLDGTLQHTITGVKCGTQYSLRIVAANGVGASTPSYLHVSTLGGVPIPPSSVEWFWSNASHMYIQLSGWDENGCEITNWEVEYKELTETTWKTAENKIGSSPNWAHYSGLSLQPNSFVIGDLRPASWYQVKVTATNSAGVVATVYNYATTTQLGETVGPPLDYFDLNFLVIVCSSVLLTICVVACFFILIRRNHHNGLTAYRNSLTTECKSESGNMTDNCQSTAPSVKDCGRVYSAPIHVQDNKHELYEISPYAQFALGFRTFGHVDNQEPPMRMLPTSSSRRYDSETSFQIRSESEESDCVSRTTTLKSAPRKACRVPHHR